MPCHSVASRCAWIPVPSLLRHFPDGRFQSVLCRLRSCRSVSPRLHAFSSLIFSDPLLALSEQLCSIPWPFASSRVHSLPSPVLSGRCHAIACQLISVCTVHGHSASHPRLSVRCHAVSNPGRAMRFRIQSELCSSHRLHASPPLFDSDQCFSMADHIVSTLYHFCSDPCASAGLVSNSARSGSCPSFSLSPPCHSWRIGSQQRHCASSLVSAELIRCHSTQVKSGLITSVANRGCARQIPVSSAPPAPISAVPVRFPSAQFGTPPFHLYSSSILSKRRRSIASRLKAHRRAHCSTLLIRLVSSRCHHLVCHPFRFAGIRRAAFPFHFAVTQGCALPWQCHSHRCRFVASPIDSDHCCAAPSPRYSCLVYSMP